MRAVVQRVVSAAVRVADQEISRIDKGFLILVGVATGDTEHEARILADRIAGMRIFSDAEGKFKHSILDVQGAALAVSQFTLYGDPWSGRRPFFGAALAPELAKELFEFFVAELRRAGIREVQTGQFRAMMSVELVNDGPVTVIVDTADRTPEG